jgi:hypothetical protein
MICPGNSRVINQRFCEHEPGGYELANGKQDLGEPDQRRAMRTCRPDHFVEEHWLPF